MTNETKRTIIKVLNEAHNEAVVKTSDSLKKRDLVNLKFWQNRLKELRNAKKEIQQ